ncbi:MAG: hypothetical protein ACJ72Z_12265, partial [Pyrinomonadaceae bacterium]
VLMVCGGLFQLARFARGEYFRWQVRGYYQEIADTVQMVRRPESVCFSIYVELVVPSGCSFYFDDFGEYTTNWTPALRSLFENEVRAGRFSVIIWSNDNFQQEFPNYQLVRMEHPLPERFFPVYLYVLRQ